ncbi:hypothetical protein L0222_08940 [bacterium]|nr:hypothetical protein [bacterium]MCI0603170.1 hypothetical protein [bacterium]
MADAKEGKGSFLMILLLALYSFFMNIPVSGRPEGETESNMKLDISPSSYESDLQQLLREYWTFPPSFDTDSGAQINFLIALLPDPQDAHAGWLFDPFLDSIQRAVESSGYVLDRYKIPWKRLTEKEKSKDSIPQSSNIEHRNKPGVVLFRDQKDPNQLLALFLVGESPTSGLHKIAFLAALNEIERYKGNSQFLIVGPSFSGTAGSISIATRAWLASRISYHALLIDPLSAIFEAVRNIDFATGININIISGSATSIDKARFERSFPPPLNVYFRTTTISDRTLVSKFLIYLASTYQSALERKKVAMLTEANTEFGNSIQDITLDQVLMGTFEDISLEQVRPSLEDAGRMKHVSETKELRRLKLIERIIRQRSAQPASGLLDLEFYRELTKKLFGKEIEKEKLESYSKLQESMEFIQLPFPIHTAHVRTAHEKERVKKGEYDTKSKEITKPGLGLSLEEEGDPSDLIPSLAPDMVSRISDEVIADILTTIAREEVRYVGIFATDTRDKIFLARQVQSYSPNVRIFTTDSDILYAHSNVTQYTKGMIVVSTYPLMNLNQSWTGGPAGVTAESRLQFPSGSAQGVYNATIAILRKIGRDGQLLEYSLPQPLDSLDKSDASFSRQGAPPVWISVVGNGGVWPIRSLTHSDSQMFGSTQEIRKSGKPTIPVHYFLEILILLIALFSLAHCLGLMDRWKILKAFWINSPWKERAEPNLCVLVLFSLMLACNIALFRISLIASSDILRWQSLVSWISIAATLWTTCQIAATWFLATLDSEDANHPLKERMVRIFFQFLIPAGLFFYVWIKAQEWSRHNWDHVYFYLRASNPLSGLSPVIPLLFLAASFYLFVLLHLKRLYLLRTFNMGEELENLDVLARGGLGRLAGKTNRLLRSSALTPPFLRELLRFARLLIKRARLLLTQRLLRWSFHHPGARTPNLLLFESSRGEQKLEERQQRDEEIMARLKDISSRLKTLQDQIEELTFKSRLELWYFLPILFVVVCFPGVHVFRRFLPTFDGTWFDTTFLIALLGSYIFVLISLIKFFVLSRYMKKVMERLAAHPIVEAYSRLPSTISTALGGRLYIQRPTLLQLYAPATLSKSLYPSSEIETILNQELAREPIEDEWSTGQTSEELLRSYKKTLELRGSILGPLTGKPWNARAEEFLALRVVFVLREIFMHLRNYLMYATAGSLLMLFAVNSYPFQPKRLLMVILSVLTVVVISTALAVLIQMNRDEILSRISKTSVNKISWDRSFASRLLMYVVLPLVTLFAAQFPEVGGFLLSWLEPVQRALR